IKVSPPPKGSSSSGSSSPGSSSPGSSSPGSSPAFAPAASSQPAANPYASLPASAAVVSSTPNVVAAPAAAAPARPAVGLRPVAQPLENLIGRTLNHRYLVEDKVGEGGFGAVFRGKQLATGREVALKILHPHNVSDETIVARFRREAEACSKLRDPHTVTTYDFDETPDG